MNEGGFVERFQLLLETDFSKLPSGAYAVIVPLEGTFRSMPLSPDAFSVLRTFTTEVDLGQCIEQALLARQVKLSSAQFPHAMEELTKSWLLGYEPRAFSWEAPQVCYGPNFVNARLKRSAYTPKSMQVNGRQSLSQQS